MAQDRSNMAMEKQRIELKKQITDSELMPPPSSLPLPHRLKIKNKTGSETDHQTNQPIKPFEEKKLDKDAESLDDVFELFISKIEGMEQGRQNMDKEKEEGIYNEIPNSSPWKEVLEPNTSKIYYWNTQNGQVSWELPKDLTDDSSLTLEDPSNSTSTKLSNSKKQQLETIQKNTDLDSNMKTIFDTNTDVEDKTNSKLIPTSIIKYNDQKIEQFAYQLDLLQALIHSGYNSLIEIINSDGITNEKERQTKSNLENEFSCIPINKVHEDLTCIKSDNQSIFNSTKSLHPSTDLVSPLRVESQSNLTKLTEDSLTFASNPKPNISENSHLISANNLRITNLPMDENCNESSENYSTEKADPLLNKIFELLNKINRTILHNISIIDNNYKLELKVQIDTRMSDWSAGELSSEYFITKLNETIKNFEDSVDSPKQNLNTQTMDTELGSTTAYETMTYDPNSNLSYDFNSNNLTLDNIYGFSLGSMPVSYFPTMTYDYHNIPIINHLCDTTMSAYNQAHTSTRNNADLTYFSSSYTHPYDKSSSLNSTTSISGDNQMLLNYSHHESITNETLVPPTSINSGQALEVPSKKKKKSSMLSLSQRKKLELTDTWKKSAELAKLEDEVEADEQEDLDIGRQRQDEILIEKWKESQKSSGAAAKNVNFIPLVNDWRTIIQKHEANE